MEHLRGTAVVFLFALWSFSPAMDSLFVNAEIPFSNFMRAYHEKPRDPKKTREQYDKRKAIESVTNPAPPYTRRQILELMPSLVSNSLKKNLQPGEYPLKDSIVLNLFQLSIPLHQLKLINTPQKTFLQAYYHPHEDSSQAPQENVLRMPLIKHKTKKYNDHLIPLLELEWRGFLYRTFAVPHSPYFVLKASPLAAGK